MSNNYTPPSTINFYGAGSNGLIYYNHQLPSINATISTAIGQTRITVSNITNVSTTITVASTSQFGSSGTICIDSEQITYSSKTPTTFVGCTRGTGGTTAAAHLIGALIESAFTTIPCYTPNLINITEPGDYIITVNTSAASNTANDTVRYKFLITKSGQEPIFVTDYSMLIVMSGANFPHAGSFSRKVTFPATGIWTLTPQWGIHLSATVFVEADTTQPLSTRYPWIVLVHAANPLNAVNTQLTQFVDADYTLMTNVDANAYWGSLANSTVVGYGSTITSLNNNVVSQQTLVNTLSTQVTNLQNTVSGLTSIAINSGGIRIKPA